MKKIVISLMIIFSICFIHNVYGATCEDINYQIGMGVATKDSCQSPCLWESGSCKSPTDATCSSLNNATCISDAYKDKCTWDQNNKKCVVKINAFIGEEGTATNVTTKSSGGKCSSISNETNCNNTTGCKWNGKKCTALLSIIGDVDNFENKSCETILGNSFLSLIKEIENIFRIVAPLLVLGLSTFDYVSAVVSKDAEGLKKANNKIIRRLILIVILFFLPTLVDIILGFTIDGYSSCL